MAVSYSSPLVREKSATGPGGGLKNPTGPAINGLEPAGEPRVGAEHVAGALREELDGRVRAFKHVGDADRCFSQIERFGGHELYGGHDGWL